MRDSVRRAGERLLAGFEGQVASADIKHLLRHYAVGNVILFSRNVDGPEQVAELVRELQSLARQADHERPLLIAIDQEGGRVARLREPWTLWPPLRAVGRTGSEPVAERLGVALGEELAACGVNWNLAPVVDLDTNPANPVIGDRSLGDDPDLVGRLGAALVRGLQQAGVAACAKHFPGHGDTEVDSHLALPAVDHPLSRLEAVELRPFRTVIEAGVAAVMTAHVLVRALDERLPASLSALVLQQLLRRHAGFAGVVVSDDLEMEAVAARWRPGPAAVLAVRAGCDVVAVCKRPDAQVEALEALVHAGESGELSWKEADAALSRIRALKDRFALQNTDPDPRRARLAAGRPEHRALADEIAARAGLRA